MVELDPQRVGAYFERPGTVEHWWTPDEGPLDFHYNAELKVLVDTIEIDPSWEVLDVGTGRGRFGLHFAGKGCRVVGVDANPGMREAAAANAEALGVADRFRVQAGKAEDLTALGTDRFDLALCMELFDHLPDLAVVLEQIRMTMKPQARLAFTYVPSESIYGSVGNVYRWLKSRRGQRSELISRTYTLGAVKDALAGAGLRLDAYWGVGLACASAQTRLFMDNPVVRLMTAVARAESRVRPYHSSPLLARPAAHVVGVAVRADAPTGAP